MNCPKCNTENPPGAKFCSGCGSELVTNCLCSKCGSEIRPDTKFCTVCGNKVTQTQDDVPSIEDEPCKPNKKEKKSIAKKVIIAVVVLVVLFVGATMLIEKGRHSGIMESQREQEYWDAQKLGIQNAKITSECNNGAILKKNRTYDYYFECDVVNPSKRYFRIIITLECQNGDIFTVSESIDIERKHFEWKLNVSDDPIGIKDVSVMAN